jgi:hypothetical protein
MSPSKGEPPDSRDRPKRRRLTNARAVVVAAVIGLVGVLITALAGVFYSDRRSEENAPEVCLGGAATVRGPVEGGAKPDFAVEHRCKPAPGKFHLVISEVLNVDAKRGNSHSEYYAKHDISTVPVGEDFSFALDFRNSSSDLTRRIYVIEVDEREKAEIGRNVLPGGGTLGPLPEGHRVVSNKHPYTRRW